MLRFTLIFLILVDISFLFSACSRSAIKSWSGVPISGTLLDTSGDPVSGAYIYAYELEDNGISVPAKTMGPADAMSEPSTENGRYLLIVPEGSYVLAARKRISGSISGPLRNGDLAGQVPHPVKAAHGDQMEYSITLSVFRQGVEGDPKRILTTNTRIEGRVVDLSGKAVAGAHVFAYEGQFSSDIPDFMAETTDEVGQFSISLPGGGSYAIGARTGLRGKPRPEDSIGFWGDRDSPHRVQEGTVTKGVIIVVVPYGESTTERPGS